MWNIDVMGIDTYHIVWWFITYSMLGWLIESVYMSICNGKLTNRGFAKGPFCPIYGVGALSVFFLLRNYSDNVFVLYILGAIFATMLEFFTAVIMIRLFGSVWWDYRDKPFNYKGILCMESTVAWGFYTVFLFAFLQLGVMFIVDQIPYPIGLVFGKWIMILYSLDFLYAIYHAKRESIKESIPERVMEVKDAIINRILK